MSLESENSWITKKIKSFNIKCNVLYAELGRCWSWSLASVVIQNQLFSFDSFSAYGNLNSQMPTKTQFLASLIFFTWSVVMCLHRSPLYLIRVTAPAMWTMHVTQNYCFNLSISFQMPVSPQSVTWRKNLFWGFTCWNSISELKFKYKFIIAEIKLCRVTCECC